MSLISLPLDTIQISKQNYQNKQDLSWVEVYLKFYDC